MPLLSTLDRGYAFVEFEKEEDMTAAYKKVRGGKERIGGRRRRVGKESREGEERRGEECRRGEERTWNVQLKGCLEWRKETAERGCVEIEMG
jgi:RNA recognition motif-containing protein